MWMGDDQFLEELDADIAVNLLTVDFIYRNVRRKAECSILRGEFCSSGRLDYYSDCCLSS